MTLQSSKLALRGLILICLTALPPAALDAGEPQKGQAAAGARKPVNFSDTVRPILTTRCFRCHGPDDQTREAELRLDDASAARRESPSGDVAIVPGKPADSQLIARIFSDDPDLRMPPPDAGELKPQEKQILRRWILEGAQYQRHWSFAPPQRPSVPLGPRREATHNTIDAFVRARLPVGVEPSKPASRYALIRRVSLDLTGLPPNMEQTRQFLADKRPDAYARLVTRLLASPAYGERWGRVWLDLARYADSAGYAQDPARQIWRYRDWVIQAFNDGRAFDQFTIEQLAGDLLPSPTTDQLLATAFHRNTMTNSEGGTDDEEFRNAAVVDRVNTTMQVWMGLTMGCAQCHTHKYDPITQQEYFQFFAILNNTEDADRGDESPNLEEWTPQLQHRRSALQRQIDELEKQKPAAKRPKLATSGPLAARFVRVELPGTGVFLSLAEVQTFAASANVASGGKAGQISTDFGGPAKLAIDGNTDGNYAAARSTTHTKAETNPWWELDLQKSVALDRVVLFNRTDGVGGRLKGFRLILLDAKRKPLFVYQGVAAPTPSQAIPIPKSLESLTKTQRQLRAGYHVSGATDDSPRMKQLQTLRKQLAAIKPIRTPILRELPRNKQRQTRIQLRGNFRVTGDVVGPRVPSAFHALPSGSAAPNRLDAAQWLISKKNPLTARVLVNRYWEQFFGVGLVETSEDFGRQGEPPSHPKLLDYLATELIHHDWDTKWLCQYIVTSATYGQTSRVSRELARRDPKNRLLARGPRFRLSAEMIRDQALAVSGLLSRTMYGPSVRPPRPNLGLRAAFGGSTDWSPSPGGDRFRRGLYTSWRRTSPYPSMTTFDAPSREVCTVRRIRTNTPLQALVTLNDPVFVEAAQATARRAISQGGESLEQQIRFAFRLCLIRPPTTAEQQRLQQLYAAVLARMQAEPAAALKLATVPRGPLPKGWDVAETAAWTVLANVLLNLDEVLARP